MNIKKILLLFVLFLLCTACGNKSDEENISDKEEFASVSLSIAKAAENAYVDQMLSGSKAFSINDINGTYGSFNGYRGCISIKADEDGLITDKLIYITDDDYMIIGVSTDYIMDDVDESVEKYSTSGSNGWKSNYELCELN